MKHQTLLCLLGLVFACAVSAQEQGVASESDKVIEVPALSRDQRDQIKADLDAKRAALEAQYKEEKRACYQLFNVGGCQRQARERYLQAHVVLRKQELQFRDNERQIKAQETADNLAERVSEDNQRKAQEQRDQAVQDAQQRHEENARKQLDFASKVSKRDQYDQKQKEAQDHRQSVQDQINERDKPASAPLPMPPEVQR
jgi:hypothetical protein